MTTASMPRVRRQERSRYGGIDLQANTRVGVLLHAQDHGSSQRRFAHHLPTLLEP